MISLRLAETLGLGEEERSVAYSTALLVTSASFRSAQGGRVRRYEPRPDQPLSWVNKWAPHVGREFVAIPLIQQDTTNEYSSYPTDQGVHFP